jgi:hypothetical protein
LVHVLINIFFPFLDLVQEFAEGVRKFFQLLSGRREDFPDIFAIALGLFDVSPPFFGVTFDIHLQLRSHSFTLTKPIFHVHLRFYDLFVFINPSPVKSFIYYSAFTMSVPPVSSSSSLASSIFSFKSAGSSGLPSISCYCSSSLKLFKR